MAQIASATGRRLELEIDDRPDVVAEHAARLDRFRQNARCFDRSAHQIELRHAGKYVCVAGGELFAGDSLANVLAVARQQHPGDDAPFVHFVPKERATFLGGVWLRFRSRPDAENHGLSDGGEAPDAD